MTLMALLCQGEHSASSLTLLGPAVKWAGFAILDDEGHEHRIAVRLRAAADRLLEGHDSVVARCHPAPTVAVESPAPVSEQLVFLIVIHWSAA